MNDTFRRQNRIGHAVLAVFIAIGMTAVATAKPAPQTVDLDFTQTDVQTILSALAATVGFNLVVGSGVEGDIDVHLSGVDWETALNTLVSAHGFQYFWNDDVLVVMASDADSREGLVHRVVRLKYADPVTIQNALAGVMSKRGKIELVGAPADQTGPEKTLPRSTIIVTEVPHHLDDVLALIEALDTALPQFEIGVKFVETDVDAEQGVGFNWPTRIGATVSNRAENNTSNGSTTTTQNNAAAEYPIPDGKIWKLGTLSIDELNGFIEFMQQNGTGRILSDPSVSVLENEKATMKVVTTIPIQTLNRFTEGAIIQDIVDFQDLDVGISLTVVPRLNESGKITLDVEPVVEEITGFTGPADNQRPITAKRSVKTSVRVGDGQTLVIGGLVKETEFTTKSSVFFLGKIPILGALFTHNSVQKQKTDLLIFITPRLLSPES